MEYADRQYYDEHLSMVVTLRVSLAYEARCGHEKACESLLDKAVQHAIDLRELDLDGAMTEARNFDHVGVETFLLSVCMELEQ